MTINILRHKIADEILLNIQDSINLSYEVFNTFLSKGRKKGWDIRRDTIPSTNNDRTSRLTMRNTLQHTKCIVSEFNEKRLHVCHDFTNDDIDIQFTLNRDGKVVTYNYRNRITKVNIFYTHDHYNYQKNNVLTGLCFTSYGITKLQYGL